jgi:hypothetical protein
MVAGMMAAGGTAQAHASAPSSIRQECERVATECVLALVLPGEDPVVDAVRQLRLRGDDEAAERFAGERRAAFGVDDVQDDIQRVLNSDASDLETPRGEVALFSPLWDDGEVIWNYKWQLAEMFPYTYCIPARGCDADTVGEVEIRFDSNITWYPDVEWDGQVRVDRGPRIALNAIRCTVYQESFPFDQAKFAWPNCTDAQGIALGYTEQRQVYEASTLLDGFRAGDKFHTEVFVEWEVEGDPTGSRLSVLRNSHTFKQLPELSPGSPGQAEYPYKK